jgi:hypothetical protein
MCHEPATGLAHAPSLLAMLMADRGRACTKKNSHMQWCYQAQAMCSPLPLIATAVAVHIM